MHPDNTVPQNQARWQQMLIGVAAIAAVISLFLAANDTPRFFQVYLIGYLFWVEIAVGCLGIVLMNNLINGRWLYPVLRFAEAGVRTMPLLAILFIPILLGLGDIYPWMDTLGELKGGKNMMLTPTFFALRTFIYIAVWTFLGYTLTNWSYKRDQDVNAASEDTMRNFSAVGAIFYVLTTTLAGFDWTQSLVPEFFSSAWGWAVLSRMWLAMVALIIVVMALYWGREQLEEVVDRQIINDLGAVLLASFLGWVYFYGIQIVIIYSGNVAFNALWFDLRIHGDWRLMTQAFAFANVVVLLLLLIPGIKGNRFNLVGISALILILHAVELYWVVMPTYGELSLQVWDFMPVLAVGGLWLTVTLYFLERQSLLPVHHPSLGSSDAQAGAAEAYTVPKGGV